MSRFLHPSREDAKPVTYREKTAILHLINQTSLLIEARRDLADRAQMIEGGAEMLQQVCETSEKLLEEIRLTIPEKQRATINNITRDSEMRLVPKMSPTVGHLLIDNEDYRELVDAARAKCHGCADTPEQAKRCGLYRLLLNILPLDSYDTAFLCPYNQPEWKTT